MAWYDQFLGSRSTQQSSNRFPLGARLGGAVTIDATPFAVLAGRFAFDCPSNPQMIEAIGEIALDDHGAAGSKLTRLYLTDDAFVQISTVDGALSDIKLFVYDDTINPANQADFQRWVQSGSRLGQDVYELNGKHYQRLWGNSADGNAKWAPPVVLEERVFKRSASVSDYGLTLYTMLYERAVDDTDRTELLAVAAEDSGPDDFCVSQALGTTLREVDIEFT